MIILTIEILNVFILYCRIYFSNRGQGIVESVGLNGQQRLTIMATQQVDLYGVAMHQVSNINCTVKLVYKDCQWLA